MQSQHIVLEGLTCAGKTSIANELLKRINDSVYIKTFDSTKTHALIETNGYEGLSFEDLFATYALKQFEAIKKLTELGKNVIQDRGQWSYESFHEVYIKGSQIESELQQKIKTQIISLPTIVVYCYADLDIRKKRFIQRKDALDRFSYDELHTHIGQKIQMTMERLLNTHPNAFIYDTSATLPETVAEDIIRRIEKCKNTV